MKKLLLIALPLGCLLFAQVKLDEAAYAKIKAEGGNTPAGG